MPAKKCSRRSAREEVPSILAALFRRALDGASLAPPGASPWLFAWWPLFVGPWGFRPQSQSQSQSQFLSQSLPSPTLFLARSRMLSPQSLSAGFESAGAGLYAFGRRVNP